MTGAAITFKPARRENVRLLIGLSGGTGSGKTFTAMRLAKGLAGGKRFAVIDTENGRASFYADQFDFDAAELHAPFTPLAYADAILAADAAGYPVTVVDSASHEWSGEGGILDMQEAELDRMAGNDYGKREACKMAAWIKPKMQHKAFIQKLLQVRGHVILCFRAEPKVEMVRGEGKRVEVRAKQGLTGLDGWFPICEKNLPFELTVSFLLLATAPGIPHPIKLPQQHKAFFPLDQVITEAAGAAIGEWARGGSAPIASSSGDALRGFMEYAKGYLEDATDPDVVETWWSSPVQVQQRRELNLSPSAEAKLRERVTARVQQLRQKQGAA